MAQGAIVRIEGLEELVRAFKRTNKDLLIDLEQELGEAAEPVRKAATQIILGEMRNIPRTPLYAGMRIGLGKMSGAEGQVYIVPDWRGRLRKRPNIKREFQPRMERAVEQNAGEIEARFGAMLDRLAAAWAGY